MLGTEEKEKLVNRIREISTREPIVPKSFKDEVNIGLMARVDILEETVEFLRNGVVLADLQIKIIQLEQRLQKLENDVLGTRADIFGKLPSQRFMKE